MRALRSGALLATLVAFSSLASTPALAEPNIAAARALLDSPTRPTPSDLRRAYGGTIPAENPFKHHYPLGYNRNQAMNVAQGMRHEHLVGHLRATMPKAIAHLEKAYPGATYAALGRDVVVMSDALDAYYGAIGQHGRAVRVNASTASFWSRDYRDTVDLVTQSTGLDLDHVHERGFVLYDNTSYGANSQSRKVMSALYTALQQRGANTADYAHKLTLATIWHGSGAQMMPTAGADAFLANHVASQKQKMGPRALGPAAILRVPGIGYGLEWHGSFGPMARTAAGVTTTPGALAGIANRESILWEAHEMLRLTESPEFHQLVEQETQQLGIKAPHENVGN